MDTSENYTVLCGASSYTKKFYLNPQFDSLPEGVRQELKIMCVLYTAEVSGEIELVYDAEGCLIIRTDHRDEDALFDEIGSGLMVREMQRRRRDLLESLEMYYKVFVLGEKLPEDE